MADDTVVPEVTISLDTARAVLAAAKSGGFMTDPIPSEDEEVIKEAEYWFAEAFKAEQAGMKHDTVIEILNNVQYAAETNPGGGSDYHPGYASVADVVAPVTDDLRVEPVENTASVEEGLNEPVVKPVDLPGKNNLPVPKDWQGDPEPMPRDISELTDKDVRRLSGEYNAYAARAKWLLAVAISDLAQANHLRDHAYRQSLKKVVRVDATTEKAKLKEVMDAEARDDAEYKTFDEAVLRHQNDVTTLKALVEIYSGNVDRLSREWTMRQNEWEKSR